MSIIIGFKILERKNVSIWLQLLFPLVLLKAHDVAGTLHHPRRAAPDLEYVRAARRIDPGIPGDRRRGRGVRRRDLVPRDRHPRGAGPSLRQRRYGVRVVPDVSRRESRGRVRLRPEGVDADGLRQVNPGRAAPPLRDVRAAGRVPPDVAHVRVGRRGRLARDDRHDRLRHRHLPDGPAPPIPSLRRGDVAEVADGQSGQGVAGDQRRDVVRFHA